MSTDTAEARAPEDRGELVIADRVVSRVAAHAVRQVPHAAAAPRRVLGIAVSHGDANAEPHVEATVHGHSATVEATIAVRWPHSIREVAHQVRQRIVAEVADLAAITVDHIDLDVSSCDVAAATRRRVQ